MCHVNMLKYYHGREVVESSGMVTLGCIAKNSEQDITTDECKEIERSSRLRNSEVMNLDHKLNYLPVQEKEMLKELLGEFTTLFPDVPGKTTVADHDIDVDNTPPNKQHPYRVNPVKLMQMRNKADYMLKNGMSEPSESQWSSPFVLVPKSDDIFRFCTDFRKINGISKTDTYPIPHVNDCFDRIGHAKYASEFDLLKGYWQVPLTKQVQELSAFITPDGLFQYCVKPFGLKNASATFQRMMINVIHGLEGCDAYIDDLVLYSQCWEDYEHLLKKIFGRL